MNEQCNLNYLCARCKNMFVELELEYTKNGNFSVSREAYNLHASVESLDDSVANRCHLCTLIWQVLHDPCGGGATINGEGPVHVPSIEGLPVTQMEKRKRAQDGNERLHGQIRVAFLSYFFAVICGEPESAGWDSPQNGNWKGLYLDHRIGQSIHSARNFASTMSTAHEQLARYWLTECSQKHPQCNTCEASFRPTRLLFLPSRTASHVQLHISAKGDDKITYFALSHCWAGAEDILTLRQSSILKLSNSIPITDLAKTFQHAIRIVTHLGGQYL
jgi:hypothetical protein